LHENPRLQHPSPMKSEGSLESIIMQKQVLMLGQQFQIRASRLSDK
jgi:hypothetical protein